MRSNSFLITLLFGLGSCLSLPAPAAAQGCSKPPTFGSVTAIGGTASDIALDESRGLLYIANFGAAQIDVMSVSNCTIQTAMNVAPQPGALAVSQDDKYL